MFIVIAFIMRRLEERRHEAKAFYAGLHTVLIYRFQERTQRTVIASSRFTVICNQELLLEVFSFSEGAVLEVDVGEMSE